MANPPCSGCGKDVGPLFCAHCRDKIEQAVHINHAKLIPLLYYDTEKKGYRAGCTVSLCPWNDRKGVCNILMLFISAIKFHEFDGDNVIRQACG